MLDPYRAGLELGETLRGIDPEAVILFPSVHYSEGVEDLFEGLYDGLENRELLVVGGTGDGFYEGSVVESIGVGAMGFSGGGAVEWGLAMSPQGAVSNPRAAGVACSTNLIEEMGGEPDFAITFAPMTCDGTLFAEGIREAMTAPCVGALTGDDRQFKGGAVLANGQVVGDAAVMLGLKGGFGQTTQLGAGLYFVGTLGVLERSEGTTIFRISGLPATEFLRKQWGSPMSEEDLAVVSFAVVTDGGEMLIRTPITFDNDEGTIRLFGSIPEGSNIQICCAKKDRMLVAVSKLAATCMDQVINPSGALVISCAGRKWLLGEEIQQEMTSLIDSLPQGLPFLGLPSFGEFGPQNNSAKGEAEATHFHNVTCVMTLFGDAS